MVSSRSILCFFFAFSLTAFAQNASFTDPPSTAASVTTSPARATVATTSTAPTTTKRATRTTTGSGGSSITGGASGILSGPPDVLLNVPTLSVGRIELEVDNLQADLNLNAKVASLVTINAGVAVSIQKVNLTITDVDAQLELIVRLGHLVDIVNRVFQSLDLNPLLISTLNNVTSLVGDVVGQVDGLLGSITQGGNTLSFVIDNLGNIVQQVTGATGTVGASSIVGNYLQNMTQTGATQTLSNGLVQKTFSYSPLNALVNIIFNAAGQVVQATVAKMTGSTTTTSAASKATAATRR